MPEPKLAEHLRRYPLFAKLSDTELLTLAERSRTRSFKRGEALFRKDDPGTHLYVVLDGSVKIALPGEFGQEALVSIMRKGDFFGELALFDPAPRNATVTAVGKLRLAVLTQPEFHEVLKEETIRDHVLAGMARRLHELDSRDWSAQNPGGDS